ncbi:SPBc2 prophage-derived uncharacterized protein yomO [Bacillus subtilis]|nr:SPBc2 prophage-derived uncharacterized protein yomO [Bacillus subtilis]
MILVKSTLFNGLFFSIVKEFSDLGIPNDIKNKVKWYLKLVDSEFFPMIINSFPKESMKKLKDATKALEKITEDLLTMSPPGNQQAYSRKGRRNRDWFW